MAETRFRNGVRHPSVVKEEAKRLRREGHTHREIQKALNISRGSAYEWTKEIVISVGQKDAIYERRTQKVYTPERRARYAEIARVRLAPYWKPYAREDLLKKINDFYKQNDRIPLKREFNSLRVFRKYFGSWNGAIQAAGFEPNPVLFAKKFIANDGHPCDSFSEKIIDDWLFERWIPHTRNWKYAGTKMTADFFMGTNTVVEFFGLAGVQKRYDALVELKRNFCAENNFRLVELYPNDLFPENNIEEKLKEVID